MKKVILAGFVLATVTLMSFNGSESKKVQVSKQQANKVAYYVSSSCIVNPDSGRPLWGVRCTSVPGSDCPGSTDCHLVPVP